MRRRAQWLSVLLTVACVAPIFPTPNAQAAGYSTYLSPGQSISKGDQLSSSSGEYKLRLQLDGNLVQYDGSDNPIWYTGITGSNVDRLTYQNDGNIVLYDTSNNPLWASRTFISNPNQFVVQDDGNIVMYDTYWFGFWNKDRVNSTNTMSKGDVLLSGTGGYRLVFQHDGNIVLYNQSGVSTWVLPLRSQNSSMLTFQHDGNIVLRDASGLALWESRTKIPNPAYCDFWGCKTPNIDLVLQADGNLVAYDYFDANTTIVAWSIR